MAHAQEVSALVHWKGEQAADLLNQRALTLEFERRLLNLSRLGLSGFGFFLVH
jgi:hypothetical protein